MCSTSLVSFQLQFLPSFHGLAIDRRGLVGHDHHLTIPQLPLYIFATPILKLLGQRKDIAELAGKFTIRVIPQMVSLAINFPTQKFLQAQSKVGVLAWIGFAALIMHIGVLYLFVNVFKWGLAGAAISYHVSGWVIALGQLAMWL
ncbi:hypothetical protein H0E87_024364, partial [Populus deltoides]